MPLGADGEQRRVAPVGIEPECGDPPGDFAVVEPVVLQVFEEIAGESQLGRGHGMAARQLERECRLAVMENEPVVLARLASRMGDPERRDRATCDDR